LREVDRGQACRIASRPERSGRPGQRVVAASERERRRAPAGRERDAGDLREPERDRGGVAVAVGGPREGRGRRGPRAEEWRLRRVELEARRGGGPGRIGRVPLRKLLEERDDVDVVLERRLAPAELVERPVAGVE